MARRSSTAGPTKPAGYVTLRSGRRVALTLPPPTPEQSARRQFLLAPITIRVHGRSYPWAGCLITSHNPDVRKYYTSDGDVDSNIELQILEQLKENFTL